MNEDGVLERRRERRRSFRAEKGAFQRALSGGFAARRYFWDNMYNLTDGPAAIRARCVGARARARAGARRADSNARQRRADRRVPPSRADSALLSPRRTGRRCQVDDGNITSDNTPDGPVAPYCGSFQESLYR